METFYVSCSSHHRKLARSVAESLEGLGMRWSGGWAWPDRFNAIEEDPDKHGPAAAMDVAAGVAADLFVLMVTPASFGAGFECGARSQVGKPIHVVVPDTAGRPDSEMLALAEQHPFFKLPNMTIWVAMKPFYAWVRTKRQGFRS